MSSRLSSVLIPRMQGGGEATAVEVATEGVEVATEVVEGAMVATMVSATISFSHIHLDGL